MRVTQVIQTNEGIDCALSLVVKLYVHTEHIKLDYQSKGTSLSLPPSYQHEHVLC